MNLKEKPINPGKLTEITELKGGLNGKVLLLKNAVDERIVVKFQPESTSSPVAGTHILKKVGAVVPGIRMAEPADLDAIGKAIIEASAELRQWEGLWNRLRAHGIGKNALLMEFAEGQTLETMLSTEWRAFLEVIKDQTFQVQLGRILAADVFAGNNDRMFGAYFAFNAKEVKGFYNQGNLFITKGAEAKSPKPVAIDNAFAPHKDPGFIAWDKYPWELKWGVFPLGVSRRLMRSWHGKKPAFCSTPLLKPQRLTILTTRMRSPK